MGRWALRAGAVVVVAIATLAGLNPSPDRDLAAARLYRALHPSLHAMDVLDGARNLALLAGVGVVWLATARATLAGGRLRRAVTAAGAVGLLLGLGAETAQLFSPVRTASILDVITNGLGAFLGAAGLANVIAYGAREVRRLGARRARGGAAGQPLASQPSAWQPSAWQAWLGAPPLFFVAAPYAAAAWLEAFSPLGRPDRVPGAWGGPARRWAAALEYAGAHANTWPAWSDALLFAPAGALLTLWAMERGVRRAEAALLVAAGLAASWALAEVLRGGSGGDMLGWAVVVHAAASAAGAGAAAWWAGRAARGPRAVPARAANAALAAYAALLVVWSWRPFIPVGSWREAAAKLTPAAFTPMAQLAADMAPHSVADVGVGALLYAPLGAWLAYRAADRGGAGAGGLRALWPGLAVGLLAEGGQIVLAGRSFDVTDVLVQWAGLLVGATVWRAAAARVRTHAPAQSPTHGPRAARGSTVRSDPATAEAYIGPARVAGGRSAVARPADRR